MEPAMEIFRVGRGRGRPCRGSGDSQRLLGFTSQQLVSEGENLNERQDKQMLGCLRVH